MSYILKIDGVPGERQYNGLPFGRQIEYHERIKAFKADPATKTVHFRCKHKSTKAGFREFKQLYRPTQWFTVDRDGPMYHDDSFEVWYQAGEIKS